MPGAIPFSDECANSDARFTCPACYTDFPQPANEGVFTCAACQRTVTCKIRMVPQYVAELGDTEDA